ncbi:cupin domain-containing protein [Candidatus Saccharibacteria bacterium]|jgi:mannose-6-phosphate isomerase-like protein (cupin superfamily)|nr:cupin domain-containing protein [Candidatus Saccharibacteria bacterium]
MSFDYTDEGGKPYVVDIEDLTVSNTDFRVAKWTGTNLQMTVMSIKPGGEVGLEVHNDIDQFLRVEDGEAKVLMGDTEDNLDFEATVADDFAIFVPAGKWHNIINTGDDDLKIYSIYAPGEHPKGTVHKTYDEAMAAEAEHHH